MPALTVKIPLKDLDEAYRVVIKHMPAGKWITKKDAARLSFRIGLKEVKAMSLGRVLEALNLE